MSGLKSMKDEDREGKYGYVYAVSGPGELNYTLSRIQSI